MKSRQIYSFAKIFFVLFFGLLGFCCTKAQPQDINEKVAAIVSSIPDGGYYSPTVEKKITEAKTQLFLLGKSALAPLINSWKSSLNRNQMKLIFNMLDGDKIFDSTIYSCLISKNRSNPDSRIAYLNAGILYCSIWDGATSSDPRRNWGNCSIELVDLWMKHIDDTVTIPFRRFSSDRFDFVRGPMAIVEEQVRLNCYMKFTSDSLVEDCVKKSFPDSIVNVPTGIFHTINVMTIMLHALYETKEIEDNPRSLPSSEKLKQWYDKYRNNLVWSRKDRGFILRS